MHYVLLVHSFVAKIPLSLGGSIATYILQIIEIKFRFRLKNSPIQHKCASVYFPDCEFESRLDLDMYSVSDWLHCMYAS